MSSGGCSAKRGGGDKDLPESKKPPKDKHNAVKLILIIQGIGSLVGWNTFINAKRYFVEYKLSEKYTGEVGYGGNFLAYLGIASQLPNFLFTWLNLFVPCGFSLKARIVGCIIIQVLLFIFTLVLAILDTSEVAATFFALTMTTVVFLNTTAGIYGNSVFGVAAKLGYTGAVVLGANLAGTLTSVVDLITTALAPEQKAEAIYYFSGAIFVLLTCLLTYFALPKLPFYRYHHHDETRGKKEGEAHEQLESRPGITTYLRVLRKCFPQCLNVMILFVVTLLIFPTVHSDVKMVDKNFVIPEKYFTGVTCFLTFNLFAIIGTIFSGYVQWPGPKYLWIPVTLRLLFIPFFLLCNYQPKDTVRVFMPDYKFGDWSFWVGGALLGGTSGYFSTLAMIYGPRMVDIKDAPIAGMLGGAFLITGILVGILLSSLMPMLVGNVYLS